MPTERTKLRRCSPGGQRDPSAWSWQQSGAFQTGQGDIDANKCKRRRLRTGNKRLGKDWQLRATRSKRNREAQGAGKDQQTTRKADLWKDVLQKGSGARRKRWNCWRGKKLGWVGDGIHRKKVSKVARKVPHDRRQINWTGNRENWPRGWVPNR